MKKTLIIALFTIIGNLLGSCDKMPMNGDLDGLWQLMEIKTPDGTKDTKADRRYCSFQLHLFSLGDRKNTMRYFGYFDHDDNRLRFHHFTFRAEYTENSKEDKLMEEKDLEEIAPWGFYSIDSAFDIVTLNSKSLVLRHGDTVITYRKI